MEVSRYNYFVKHIAQTTRMEEIEQNIKVNSPDPIAQYGFSQLPNFILKNPAISIGAKVVYAMFISYAWHNNLCFPGQNRLAADIGMGVASVNRFVKELEKFGLIEITRRGQGKTNLYTINYVVKQKGRKS